MAKTGEIKEGSLLDLMGANDSNLSKEDLCIRFFSSGLAYGLHLGRVEGEFFQFSGPAEFAKVLADNFVKQVPGKSIPGFEKGLSKEQCEALLNFMDQTTPLYLML
jgi:hypothetical protein